MKMNKFFMGILGALALTACSSEEVIPDQKPNIGEGEPRYMSVTIRNTNPISTRAEGDELKEGDKVTVDGGDYEIGYDYENRISSLRFYFFDENDDPIAIDMAGRSYYEIDDTDPDFDNSGDPDMDNTVEKILNAVIVINSADNEIGTKIKKMMAVANYKSIDSKLRSASGTKNMSISELLAVVGDLTKEQKTPGSSEIIVAKDELNVEADAKNGFVMTSSSYYNNGQVCAVAVSQNNIKESREAAAQNPVDIYVERVVAKVRVKAAWTMENLKTVTLEGETGGTTYTAIPLNSKRSDGSTQPIYTHSDGTEQLYVIFSNWDLWWTADKSYLFKKVGDWTSILGDWWNSTTFKRSFWAENPADVNLINYPHNYASKKIVSGSFSNTFSNEVAYCLENAAESGKDGLMKTYKPDEGTTPRTLVYLSALLVTVDDSNVAHPIELAEWAAKRNSVSNIKTSMFKSTENVIYLRSNDGTLDSSSETDNDGNTIVIGNQTYRMFALTDGDVDFVSGLVAGMANDEVENSPRYLSYLHISQIPTSKDGVDLDGKLYKKNLDGSYTEISIDDANTILHNVGGAKIWKEGNTYYYHELTHLNTTNGAEDKPNPFQKGYYGVVRNHIYEVVLQTVYGMGTPVLTPEDGDDSENWEKIIPQKPSSEFYLGARINILSWRVVPNDVTLDW